MPLQIVTVPCLADNYAYLAHDVATGAAAVIDVPEAAPVVNALAARGWRIRPPAPGGGGARENPVRVPLTSVAS